MTTIAEFIAELEAEARAEGPLAMAELDVMRLYFRADRAGVLAELSSLIARTARVVQPAYISTWLSTPMPALDGDTPIDRIVAGDCRAVARLISALEDPGAS